MRSAWLRGEGHLRLPQRLDLGEAGLCAAQGHVAHERGGAAVGHLPQRGQHRLGTLLLRDHAKALDLAPALIAPAAQPGVAG